RVEPAQIRESRLAAQGIDDVGGLRVQRDVVLGAQAGMAGNQLQVFAARAAVDDGHGDLTALRGVVGRVLPGVVDEGAAGFEVVLNVPENDQQVVHAGDDFEDVGPRRQAGRHAPDFVLDRECGGGRGGRAQVA